MRSKRLVKAEDEENVVYKPYIVDILRNDKGYSCIAAKTVVNDVLYAICRTLLDGKVVHFKGFGVFYIKSKKPSRIRARNHEGEIVEMIGTTHKRPAFKPSEKLVEIMDQGFILPEDFE